MNMVDGFKFNRFIPSINIYRPSPFKRYRYSPFNGWGEIVSNIWDKINQISDFAPKFGKSLLGKVVLYSVADISGAVIGNYLGREMFGELGVNIGRYIFSHEGLMISLGLEVFAISAFEISKERKMILASITTGMIGLTIFSNIEDKRIYSERTQSLGEEIGGFVGTILGGYLFLKLAGSETFFFDVDNPSNSYFSSNARFLVVGYIFESLIVRPTLPLISFPLCLIRKVTCLTLQNLAYNSHILIPSIQKSLKNKTFRKPQIPTLIKLLVNTYCGNNAKFFEREFSNYSLKKIFPSLALYEIDLIKKLRVPPNLFESVKEYFTNESEKLSSFAIRAFHDYAKIISNTPPIFIAHENVRDAFFHDREKLAQRKLELIGTIRTHICSSKPICNLIIHGMDVYVWNQENMHETMKKFGELINQMEVALFGIALSTPNQISFFKEVTEIYIQNYFIYLMTHYHQLEGLNSEEEYQSLLVLSQVLFKHYGGMVFSESLVNSGHSITNKALKIFYKTMYVMGTFFQQPDQSSQVNSKELSVNDEYVSDGLPMLMSKESEYKVQDEYTNQERISHSNIERDEKQQHSLTDDWVDALDEN